MSLIWMPEELFDPNGTDEVVVWADGQARKVAMKHGRLEQLMYFTPESARNAARALLDKADAAERADWDE